MISRGNAIDQLRRTKGRLAAGGGVSRAFVPFVEVCEFWLSHGFREVIIRTRMRLGWHDAPPVQASRPSPVPHATILPVDDTRELPALIIPAADQGVMVSIVVSGLSHAAQTHRCLASIVEHTTPGTYEVIVVDNGSDPNTREALSRVAGLTLIANGIDRGWVQARNQGVAAATGQYVAFLDSDTEVLERWLEPLIQHFAGSESVGAVGAKIVSSDGHIEVAGGVVWSDGDYTAYGRNSDPTDPAFNYVRDVDYCSANGLVAPRVLLEQLAGFDRRYHPAGYVDIDLCFRLRERGYRVLYQPQAVIVHRDGTTSGAPTPTRASRDEESERSSFKDRHSGALTAQYRPDEALLHLARDRRRGKRILLVDHIVPLHDQDSGSVRMAAILRMLVELGHRVTFLPDNRVAAEPYTTELQQIGIEVIHGSAGIDFVPQHCTEFDVAILCRAHFAARHIQPFLALKRRPLIIFDTVDLHFVREQRHAELEGSASLAESASRTRTVELGVMRDSDRVWVTSTFESKLLQAEAPLPPVDVVPNVHAVVHGAVPPFAGRQHMLFIGGFQHAPNEDAVLYFVKEIWPLVRAEIPEAQFLIVGSNMPLHIRGLKDDGVVALGHVPDVSPLFDGCRLSVAPLRYGAGVKGKVTQSLSLGLPTVATPIAAEGLDSVDGEHIAVAEDPATFARRIVEIYTNEILWTRLSTSGRRHIESRLGYEAVKASVAAMLEASPRERQGRTSATGRV